MSITLELPEDLESALTTEAAHLGLSLSEYTLRLLSTRILPASVPTTGQNSWPTGSAKASSGPVRISPIAKPMHGNSVTERNDASRASHHGDPDTDILIDVQRQHAPALA